MTTLYKQLSGHFFKEVTSRAEEEGSHTELTTPILTLAIATLHCSMNHMSLVKAATRLVGGGRSGFSSFCFIRGKNMFNAND